jgi:hypothetical protein
MNAEPAADCGGLAELLGGWAAGLDCDSRIAFGRLVTRGRRGLRDAGLPYAASRERILLQQRAPTAELSSWLRRCAAAAAGRSGLRARMHAACPGVARWEEVARAVPELADPLPGTGACLADVVWLLFPELHWDGPWVAWQPVGDLRDRTLRLATANVSVQRRNTLMAANRQALRLDGRAWDAWLDYCGLRRFRGLVIRSQASIADLAEAVLAERGEPMATAEIASQIRVDPWKVRDSCLGRDRRFRRTRRGVFGLAGWEVPAYPGIREFIVGQILAAGGQARLAHIAAAAADQFGVAKTSVYACARKPEFTRSDGMLSLADEGPGERRRAQQRLLGDRRW